MFEEVGRATRQDDAQRVQRGQIQPFRWPARLTFGARRHCDCRRPGPWVTDAVTTSANVMDIPLATRPPGHPSLTAHHQHPGGPALQHHAAIVTSETG